VTIEQLDARSPRLVVARFSVGDAALWAALYRHGHPVQYAHVDRPLEVWHAQTPFASRPWAVEMPSAGRPITWALIGELRRRGVGVAPITHDGQREFIEDWKHPPLRTAVTYRPRCLQFCFGREIKSFDCSLASYNLRGACRMRRPRG